MNFNDYLDYLKSYGYGASSGLTEPMYAKLLSMLSNDPGLYDVALNSARQERQERRANSPVMNTVAEIAGSASVPFRGVLPNIIQGGLSGYNERGNIQDALTGAALTGTVSSVNKMLPKYDPQDLSLAEMLSKANRDRELKEGASRTLYELYTKYSGMNFNQPMAEFVSQAMAKYKAGAQGNETQVPQVKPVNLR